MTTKLKEVSKWLKEEGIKHKYKKKSKKIVFAAGDNDVTQLHFIKMEKGSAMIQWHMQVMGNASLDSKNYVNLKDDLHKDKILEYLLRLNYRYKVGSWEYDYTDGDVRFYAALPLDDTKMTRKQFDRLLHVMTFSGAEGAKAIKYISEHGELPEQTSEAAMLLELFEAFSESKKGADDVIDADIVDS